MFLSKSNLQPIELIKSEKTEVLDNMHIEPDGSTIVRTAKILTITSPVLTEMADNVNNVLDETILETAVSVPSNIIKDLVKTIPADKQYKGVLEHTDIQSKKGEVICTTTNGKIKSTIKGKVYPKPYIDYAAPLKTALSTSAVAKVAIDLPKFLEVLQATKKFCGTGTDIPVFLEFTVKNDIVIRAVNPKNGQRIISLITSYKGIEGKWLKFSTWEKKFLEVNKAIRKKFKFKKRKIKK